jgi:hypothetical protein
MKLTHLLSHRIIVARMVATTGHKMVYVTVTAEMAHIQPMSNFKSELREGVFSKTYRLYMDGDVDIREGDRLKDDNGNFFTVKNDGVSRRTFGSFDYLIVLLEKSK